MSATGLGPPSGLREGGGAWLRGDYGFQTFGTLVAPTVSITQTGYTVGVGGEYAFLNWLTGFIEYDYYNFGNNNALLWSALPPCAVSRPSALA